MEWSSPSGMMSSQFPSRSRSYSFMANSSKVSGGSNGFPETFDSVVAQLSRLVVGEFLCPDTSA